MTEKVTITRVSATDKKKDGTKLLNKYGEYFRVGIQTIEHHDEAGNPIWLNGFSKHKPEWKEGDVLEVEIAEEVFNGQKQLNFRLPKKNKADPEVEARLKKLEDAVFGANKVEVATEDAPTGDDW